jgi:hypothetical protein
MGVSVRRVALQERPRISKKPCVGIAPVTYARLAEEAKRRGRSMRQVATEAIEHMLDAEAVERSA